MRRLILQGSMAVTVALTTVTGGLYLAADWRVLLTESGLVCGIDKDFLPAWRSSVLKSPLLADKGAACRNLVQRKVEECPLLAAPSIATCSEWIKGDSKINRTVILADPADTVEDDVGFADTLWRELSSWFYSAFTSPCTWASSAEYRLSSTDKSGSSYCLGTRTDNSTILTAAHCTNGRLVSFRCTGSAGTQSDPHMKCTSACDDTDCLSDLAECKINVPSCKSDQIAAVWSVPAPVPVVDATVLQKDSGRCLRSTGVRMDDWPLKATEAFLTFALDAKESIDPGDSGGAVLDKDGRLIAVVKRPGRSSAGPPKRGVAVPLYRWAKEFGH